MDAGCRQQQIGRWCRRDAACAAAAAGGGGEFEGASSSPSSSSASSDCPSARRAGRASRSARPHLRLTFCSLRFFGVSGSRIEALGGPWYASSNNWMQGFASKASNTNF